MKWTNTATNSAPEADINKTFFILKLEKGSDVLMPTVLNVIFPVKFSGKRKSTTVMNILVKKSHRFF